MPNFPVPHQIAPPRYPAESDKSRTISEILASVDGYVPELVALFQDLHQFPELSGDEVRTAQVVAEQFGAIGLEVSTGIGGHGVVGILRNGAGPVVALRADMDALPIREETGLAYASAVTAIRSDQTTVGVMHACGHDAHTTCLIGTMGVLAEQRSRWTGTVVAIAQPAEETMEGAAAMLADGLFSRFPRPDVVLGQHVATTGVGMVNHRSGTFAAAVRNFRVEISGRGGHGAAPHAAVDPITLGAQLVGMLQTIVAREINPIEPAVVTVGSFHAGTRPNIIPPSALLEITTRGANEQVLDQIQEAIGRIARGICEAGRAAPPTIELVEHVYATINETALTAKVRDLHRTLFGDDVIDFPAMGMGSEDFSLYAVPGPRRYEGEPIPTCYWGIGATDTDTWNHTTGESILERAMQVPTGHSPLFAIDPVPTIRRGVQALTSAALGCLNGAVGVSGASD